jgi:hypothetical protein
MVGKLTSRYLHHEFHALCYDFNVARSTLFFRKDLVISFVSHINRKRERTSMLERLRRSESERKVDSRRDGSPELNVFFIGI